MAIFSNFRLTGLLLLIAFSSCTGCGKGKADEQGGAKGKRPPMLVAVKPLQQKDLRPKVIALGSITPRKTSVVASGATGRVEHFHVDWGQYVTEGTDLSILQMNSTNIEIEEATAMLEERKQKWEALKTGSRTEDIKAAEATRDAAQTEFDYADEEFTRAENFHQRKVINQSQFDQARERKTSAQQRLIAAQANYDRVKNGPRAEELAQAKANYDAQLKHVEFLEAEKKKRTTKAPFNGFVVKKHSDVGQWFNKGDPVVTLAYLDEVLIVVNVDQWDLAHVQLGEPAQVQINGVAAQGTWEQNGSSSAVLSPSEETVGTWTGIIAEIVPQSDWMNGSRSFPVLVYLKNQLTTLKEEKTGKEKTVPVLKEGMMAKVVFEGKPTPALLAHKDAVVRTSRGTLVYVYNPGQGTVKMYEVETGVSEGEWIQVIAEGLEPGMQVVTDGVERLQNMQPVRVGPPKGTGGSDPPKS